VSGIIPFPFRVVVLSEMPHNQLSLQRLFLCSLFLKAIPTHFKNPKRDLPLPLSLLTLTALSSPLSMLIPTFLAIRPVCHGIPPPLFFHEFSPFFAPSFLSVFLSLTDHRKRPSGPSLNSFSLPPGPTAKPPCIECFSLPFWNKYSPPPPLLSFSFPDSTDSLRMRKTHPRRCFNTVAPPLFYPELSLQRPHQIETIRSLAFFFFSPTPPAVTCLGLEAFYVPFLVPPFSPVAEELFFNSIFRPVFSRFTR